MAHYFTSINQFKFFLNVMVKMLHSKVCLFKNWFVFPFELFRFYNFNATFFFFKIFVFLIEADAKGPEFLTKFNKVEHLFSAHLGLIKLIFVEEALLDLVKYFINLSSR